MLPSFSVSLVIPVFNEGKTIAALVETIQNQSRLPDEVIFVDGGSTDDTVEKINQLSSGDQKFRVIEAGRAMPGKGRNIGAGAAGHEWIAFTDAGITLDKDWLKNLVLCAADNPGASIIYGNYAPRVNNLFEKCAAITYVPGEVPGKIRGKTVVSLLLKKEVWEKAGGFPDWRATEDLVFMEKAEALGYAIATAPGALASWELRQNIASTFKKFDLYSKYNVWAGRQALWHYGVARQYAMVMVVAALGIFHHWLWLLLLPVWLLARAGKRVYIHRHQFGLTTLFNPAVMGMVMFLTLVIDTATFTGWIKAIFSKPSLASAS